MKPIKAEFENLGLHDEMGSPHPEGSYTAFYVVEEGDPGDQPQSLTFICPTDQITMNWRPLSDAPKNRPILAVIQEPEGRIDNYDADRWPFADLYWAHAGDFPTTPEGYAVIEWGGGFSEDREEGGASLPDWWFRFGSEFEEAAYPVAWMEIPPHNTKEPSNGA